MELTFDVTGVGFADGQVLETGYNNVNVLMNVKPCLTLATFLCCFINFKKKAALFAFMWFLSPDDYKNGQTPAPK